MTVDLYSVTGTKKGTVDIPATLFEAPINEGLMHQAVVMQQANARKPIAHVKRRGDISGSTRKIFAQKGTGRARRGSIRSAQVRGGNKAFGPSKHASFTLAMPQKMRRAALLSCLSAKAKIGAVIGLEGVSDETKTKTAHDLLSKLPVELGRKILIVTPERNDALTLSTRNIKNVKTLPASYLNPVDVLGSRHIVFLVDALAKAEQVFGGRVPKGPMEPKVPKDGSDTSDTSVPSVPSDAKQSKKIPSSTSSKK